MAKISQSAKSRPNDIVADRNLAFKGYSLDELRYQRTLALIRREFTRKEMTNKVYSIRYGNAFTSTKSTAKGSSRFSPSGILSKIVSGMNWLDYAMIAFSAFGTVRKIASFFGRKKRR